jgi:prevent-host-death family protein
MKIASVAEVKARLSAYLQEVATTGPVVITRNGRAVAVLLAPVDDDDLEQLLLSRSPRFQAVLSESRASIRAGKGVTHAAFWKSSAVRDSATGEAGKKPARAQAARKRASARRPPRRG